MWERNLWLFGPLTKSAVFSLETTGTILIPRQHLYTHHFPLALRVKPSSFSAQDENPRRTVSARAFSTPHGWGWRAAAVASRPRRPTWRSVHTLPGHGRTCPPVVHTYVSCPAGQVWRAMRYVYLLVDERLVAAASRPADRGQQGAACCSSGLSHQCRFVTQTSDKINHSHHLYYLFHC